MKHKINPAIDCVFKALLGNEKRKHLLIHFLNSILEYHDDPAKKITHVTILNPFNEREFEDDKLSVVDVKAQDASGRYFHVEIQIVTHQSLTQRMLYNWSTIYQAQLKKGDDYFLLQPVVSIWLLTNAVFPETSLCHLSFYAEDTKAGLILNDHFAIHVLQLSKWRKKSKKIGEKDRWIYLFKEGKNTDVSDPPTILKESQEMRDAMEILNEFSENQRNFLLYQTRLEGEFVRQTFLRGLEKALIEKEKAVIEKENAVIEKENAVIEKENAVIEKENAVIEKENALIEKEKALKEVERLKKLLKK